jgi:hypothetical protein
VSACLSAQEIDLVKKTNGIPAKVAALLLGSTWGSEGGHASVESKGTVVVDLVSACLSAQEIDLVKKTNGVPAKVAGLLFGSNKVSKWSSEEDSTLVEVAGWSILKVLQTDGN